MPHTHTPENQPHSQSSSFSSPSSFEMARPRREQHKAVTLTPEQDNHLLSLLDQAKTAENALKEEKDPLQRHALYERAISLYEQYKQEFLLIQQEQATPKESATTQLTVPDALNPFREALTQAGIPESEAPERKETKLNLLDLLQKDIESYQSSNLEDWVASLETIKDRLPSLSPEKRQILEQEIKEGAIPIFMPGSETQSQTTPDQYKTCFKPVWIKDSEKQEINDTYVWDFTGSLVTSHDPSLTQDLPDHPYIILVKPTQKPEERTFNKTLTEQQAELATINQERAEQGLAPVHSVLPLEYLTLQKRFTERLLKESPADIPLSTLDPLDKDTFTRFISLPLSPDGNVPLGYWDPDDQQLALDRDNAGNRDPIGGFRLSVRLEV